MNHDNNKVTLEGHAKLLKMFAERCASERDIDYSLPAIMKKDSENIESVDKLGVSRETYDFNDYLVKVMPEKFEGFKPGVISIESLPISIKLVKTRERGNL